MCVRGSIDSCGSAGPSTSVSRGALPEGHLEIVMVVVGAAAVAAVVGVVVVAAVVVVVVVVV